MGYQQYKFKEGLNMYAIYQKCIMKFDFDIEPHIDKKTMTTKINDNNYCQMHRVLDGFLVLLGLVEEVVYE